MSNVKTIDAITQTSVHTGNTLATIVGTLNVPGNSIGINSLLELTTVWSAPSGNVAPSLLAANLNGLTGINIFGTIFRNTSRSIQLKTLFVMDNSLSAQKFIRNASNIDYNFPSASDITNSSVDFSLPVTVDLIITLLNPADTVRLESAFLTETP